MMTPRTFKLWREQLGLTQAKAAEVLGTNPRTIAYYEAGERDGRDFPIPRYIGLACSAIVRRLGEYEPRGG